MKHDSTEILTRKPASAQLKCLTNKHVYDLKYNCFQRKQKQKITEFKVLVT